MGRQSSRTSRYSAPYRLRRAGISSGAALPPTLSHRLWTFLNSAFFLTILSGLFLSFAVKLYDDRQRTAADLDIRRGAYVELLAELQLRVSQLDRVDSELNRYLGVGPTFKDAKPFSENGPERQAFERESLVIGQRQADILAGRGSYAPSAPAYANIDMLTLVARLEHLGGVPDYFVGSIRMLRAFDAPPEVLWLFVRAYLPMLRDFVVRRHLLFTSGELPLPAGEKPNSALEKYLGLEKPKPGELEALQRQSNALHQEVQKKLGGNGEGAKK